MSTIRSIYIFGVTIFLSTLALILWPNNAESQINTSNLTVNNITDQNNNVNTNTTLDNQTTIVSFPLGNLSIANNTTQIMELGPVCTPTGYPCPDTIITSAITEDGPLARNAVTTSPWVTFTFKSTPSQAGLPIWFRCTIDSRVVEGCNSPFTINNLRVGRHLFTVQAVEQNGEFEYRDPTPATFSFSKEL